MCEEDFGLDSGWEGNSLAWWILAGFGVEIGGLEVAIVLLLWRAWTPIKVAVTPTAREKQNDRAPTNVTVRRGGPGGIVSRVELLSC